MQIFFFKNYTCHLYGFRRWGKIKFENRLLVLQNSHTHSAQKLGHTYSALKLQKTRKNRNRITSIAVSSWCHRESNQGHKDFQSFALPTELWHQILFRTTLSFDWDCKGRHFFFICKLFVKYFSNFISYLRSPI